MKISELSPLAQIQEAAQIPVAVAGENRSITLGQIIRALQGCIVPFSGPLFDQFCRYAVGSTTVMGRIVFDVASKRFYNCVRTSGGGLIDAASGNVLYDDWPGKGDFYTDGEPRMDCLYITPEGRLYRYNGEDLISAGLTDDQAALLKKLTPQPVESESVLDAMKAAGEIVPGQIYYIPEAE